MDFALIAMDVPRDEVRMVRHGREREEGAEGANAKNVNILVAGQDWPLGIVAISQHKATYIDAGGNQDHALGIAIAWNPNQPPTLYNISLMFRTS